MASTVGVLAITIIDCNSSFSLFSFLAIPKWVSTTGEAWLIPKVPQLFHFLFPEILEGKWLQLLNLESPVFLKCEIRRKMLPFSQLYNTTLPCSGVSHLEKRRNKNSWQVARLSLCSRYTEEEILHKFIFSPKRQAHLGRCHLLTLLHFACNPYNSSVW